MPRVFIPSKGRSWMVKHIEALWAGYDVTWLVDDVPEAQRYYRAGAQRVHNCGVRGRFGKAQCINWVLRQPTLQGEWVLITDDDVDAFLRWAPGWQAVPAAEFVAELARGVALAETHGTPLVTCFNDQGIWFGGRVGTPDRRFWIGAPRIGRAIGICHVIKVGDLSPIVLTYDDELIVTLQAIAQAGCMVECLHSYALPFTELVGRGGHGPLHLRGHDHTIETITREFPGLWWKGDREPCVITDPEAIAKWREERGLT